MNTSSELYSNGKYDETEPLLREAADSGEINGIYGMGLMYLYQRNEIEGLKFLDRMISMRPHMTSSNSSYSVFGRIYGYVCRESGNGFKVAIPLIIFFVCDSFLHPRLPKVNQYSLFMKILLHLYMEIIREEAII